MIGLGVFEILIVLVLLGGLIGIVGLLIFLIVRKLNQKTFQNQIAAVSNNTKKCPYCAEIIMAEAIKCKHCGSDLSKLP